MLFPITQPTYGYKDEIAQYIIRGMCLVCWKSRVRIPKVGQ